jgi:endonuclease I
MVLTKCGEYDSENDCYNREHIVPQSSYNENYPMRSDVHHVIPTDGYVNNRRGSYPFGIVASASWTSDNGSKVGSSNIPGYSGTVFEPIDEFKGDIARALLYFAVRYEDTVDDYTSFEMFNGTENMVFKGWAIDLLLDWHYNVDPVDQSERDRNNAAYTYQGNANPFVDHPEYANMIWNPNPDTQNPSNPTNLLASNPTVSTIDLAWTASTDNVAVTSYDIYVNDINTYNSSTNTFTATGLSANSNYCFKVIAKDEAGNESGFSNEACETTDSGTPGGEIDLFISEYVESGNNKAIEIANFTGNTVNLSQYTIARDVNSGGSWGASLQLIGSIANEDVHVITKGNAEAALTGLADQLSSADAMLFNGNDPVGLFKNGTLIDIFGTFAGTNDYEDIVYRRKPSVEAPTSTFNLSGEWDSYPQGTYTDLGTHTQTLSLDTFALNFIKLHPNPVKSNTVYLNTSEPLNYRIFNVTGREIGRGKVTNQTIPVGALKQGVYIIRFEYNNSTVTKKLIKQ